MTEPKTSLPDLPPSGAEPERWLAWLSTALGTEDVPIVGVLAYGSDDVDVSAIVIRQADGQELLLRPARSIVTRKLADVFAARGCRVPYYSPAQLQLIGSAVGRVARETRESMQAEASALEFGGLGAEWLERCRVKLPPITLSGRDGASVRHAIEQVRTVAAHGDERTVPPLILDTGANELLVWSAPFRRFIRERHGTAANELITVQMQRSGWRTGNLAARPGLGQTGTVELAVFVVPNGWQGFEVQNHAISREMRLI